QRMQADDRAAGKIIACPQCGQQMSVPAASLTPPPIIPISAAANPFAGLGNAPAPTTVELASSQQSAFTDFEAETRAAEEAEAQQRLWEQLPRPMPPEVVQLGTPRHIYASEGHTAFMWRILGGALALWVILAACVTITALNGSPVENGLVPLIGLS